MRQIEYYLNVYKVYEQKINVNDYKPKWTKEGKRIYKELTTKYSSIGKMIHF